MMMRLAVAILWVVPISIPVCGTSQLCNDNIPKFKESVPKSITIQAGQNAYLSCQIFCVNKRAVSWLRSSDGRILSVGEEIVIQDQRFTSLVKEENQWTLLIKHVEAQDAGKYECQVSAVTKMSRTVELIVVVPKVRIFGGPEIYVKEGSSVQLECVVSQAVNTPEYIVWEFNGKGIGGNTFTRLDPSTTTSTLSLNRVSRTQAGEYSCIPAHLPAAQVQLYVLNQDGQQIPSRPYLSGVGAPALHVPVTVLAVLALAI